MSFDTCTCAWNYHQDQDIEIKKKIQKFHHLKFHMPLSGLSFPIPLAPQVNNDLLDVTID